MLKSRDFDASQLAIGIIAAVTVFFMTRGITNAMVRSTTYQNIGEALYGQGQVDQAEEYYLKAKGIWPASAGLNTSLGRIRFEQHRYAEAAELFGESVKQSPSFVEAHLGYGSSLLATGDIDGAEREFRAALQLNPSSAAALGGLEDVQQARRLRMSR